VLQNLRLRRQRRRSSRRKPFYRTAETRSSRAILRVPKDWSSLGREVNLGCWGTTDAGRTWAQLRSSRRRPPSQAAMRSVSARLGKSLSPSSTQAEATANSRAQPPLRSGSTGELLRRVLKSGLRAASQTGSGGCGRDSARTGRVRIRGQMDVPDDWRPPRVKFTTEPLPMNKKDGNLASPGHRVVPMAKDRETSRRRGRLEYLVRQAGHAAGDLAGTGVDDHHGVHRGSRSRRVHRIPPHHGWGNQVGLSTHLRMTWANRRADRGHRRQGVVNAMLVNRRGSAVRNQRVEVGPPCAPGVRGSARRRRGMAVAVRKTARRTWTGIDGLARRWGLRIRSGCHGFFLLFLIFHRATPSTS